MVKPIVTPNICGRVLRKPKFVPDASNIKLFGPGVMLETKEKAIRAVSKFAVIFVVTFNVRPQFL